MKIVAKSNFCLDNFSEYIIAENVNSYYGKLIVKLLRDNMGDNDNTYASLEEDNYVPIIWEP
jgi:hypothetical protein